MAWDSTMKREGKSDNQMAHIVYSRFESGDTKAGVMYSLGGLYVRHYVTLVSKEALKRVEKNHPQVVVKGKGIDGWKLYDLEDMGVTREHVIPVLVLYRHLAKLHECGSLTEAYILELMPKLEIALITKEEEKKLRLAHFSRGMPGRDDWWKTGRDPLDRYRAAGLDDSIWVKLTQKENSNE